MSTKEKMILRLKELPDRLSGIYYLKNKGVIVYVGQSKIIPHRIRNHISSDKIFDSFDYKVFNKKSLCRIESDEIRKYQPKYNYYSTSKVISDCAIEDLLGDES